MVEECEGILKQFVNSTPMTSHISGHFNLTIFDFRGSTGPDSGGLFEERNSGCSQPRTGGY